MLIVDLPENPVDEVAAEVAAEVAVAEVVADLDAVVAVVVAGVGARESSLSDVSAKAVVVGFN